MATTKKQPAKKATKKATGRTSAPKKRGDQVAEVLQTSSPSSATVTSASEWRADALARPLTVPSGKTCLVKKPDGMKMFLDSGMVPNSLLPIVESALTGQEVDEKEVASRVLSDTEQLADLLAFVDRVVIRTVVEPVVKAVPVNEETGEEIPPHLRDEDDSLYVDYIDQADKMFIFNYSVSGVTDLESFRQGSNEGLADLLAIQGMG